MDRNNLLNHISKYVNLNEQEEEKFLSQVKFRSYLKGQFLVQAGDVCTYQSFVLSGSLKSFYLDDKGNEHIVDFALENSWTGDFESFLTQEPANYFVQCLENCELAQISYEKTELLYEEIPKIERLFRIIIQKAYIAAKKRIVNNISLTAKEKYLKFRKEHSQFEQRFPQYMIASYLGFTPEFLSKIRKDVAASNHSKS